MPPSTRLHRLDNGIRLATVSMPHMASVAFGLWTDAGSRHERIEEHGMAHFVEHMLFKGTPTRSAQEISRHIESLGASIDGFTVEDHTAYQIKGPAERFERLFDVLADLYRHPVFDPEEIESEKLVIHEEIAMVRDQPAQYLEDLISEAVWGKDHPLGRSITGTEESLNAFKKCDLSDFHTRAYCGRNTVISVAGNIDHDAVYEIVAARFADLPTGEAMPFLPVATSPERHRFHLDESQEQSHLALSFRSVERNDPSRFAHKLLNVILGENMSSRLFQTIREQKGLCYEVQSDLSVFSDAGLLQIYLALSPKNLKKALRKISGITDDLRENGVSDQELEEAKSYLIGQNRISLENTSAQMMWAGETFLFFDEWIDPEETHRKVDAVTSADISEAARVAFDLETLSSALIGPGKSEKVISDWLAGS
ncbi:MAG: insulinase family protein [Verrucomicrobiales bacterium]|nr:insulinase family protein [Verrucomicrobiales bacterium]HQZ28495.1 pitrilysin family protein [Verrucomicrobiales bacterium]